MTSIRDEIRAILQEEIAALRNEVLATTETVQINSSADLNHFARELVARAETPGFAEQLKNGQLTFALLGTAVADAATTRPQVPIVASSPARVAVTLDKALITESDIAQLVATERVVYLAVESRLTPLAKDEAQRKGIRIKRVET